jgi:hypothetical protein
MNDNPDQQLEELFGPRARHSEYAVGQRVRYRSDGRILTDEIDWITPADKTHPLEYWIGLNCLYQTDIIEAVDEEDEADTAILVHCPYCRTTHSPEAVQWCRNKYGKR